jgi:hypothetical protein
VINRFLEALTARDFEQLSACLAPAARARLLLPRGPDELTGRREIAARVEKWFGSASEFQVVTCYHLEIGARHHATWRFRLIRDRDSWEVIQQTAFIDVGPDGIQRIDLLCSGFLREAMPATGAGAFSGRPARAS